MLFPVLHSRFCYSEFTYKINYKTVPALKEIRIMGTRDSSWPSSSSSFFFNPSFCNKVLFQRENSPEIVAEICRISSGCFGPRES